MVTNVADAPSQLLLLFTKKNKSASPHPTLTLIKSSCPALWEFSPPLGNCYLQSFPSNVSYEYWPGLGLKDRGQGLKSEVANKQN